MKARKKRLRQDNAAWDRLYASGSSRYANEGDIGIFYRLPKFVQMFRRYFSSIQNLKILEVGGVGRDV